MDQSFVDIGRRLAELRARRGMTQQELHEASGVGLRAIQNIEQGHPGQMANYHALARVFGLETLVFVPAAAGATQYVNMDDSENLALAGWRNAIAPARGIGGPLLGELPDKPDLPALKRAAQSVNDAYRQNRYDQVSQIAPGLVRSAQFHVESVSEAQRMEAVRVRAELLYLVGRYLKQVRQLDLAMMAFGAAIDDAERLSDRELAAIIIAGEALVLIRQGRFQEVERLCMLTAQQVEPPMSGSDIYAFGAWGGLLTVAACAAARNNRPTEAREYMSLASAAAARIGDDITLHGDVCFGPVSVKMRLAEVELVGGHPDITRNLWDCIPSSDRTTPESLQRGQLDYAHSQVLTDNPDKATDIIDQLRKDAPEWLRHQRFARVVVREVLKGRKRSYTEQQRRLIDFLDLQNETDS